MIAEIPTDASLPPQMNPSNMRVRTQARIIDLTITLTIAIFTAPGKATLTEPATVAEQRGTSPSTAPNKPSWCQWCHTATHDTAACRSKPRSSTPMESPSAGSYHPIQSPNQPQHLKPPTSSNSYNTTIPSSIRQ